MRVEPVKKWNVIRAALVGAAFGFLYALAQLFFSDPVPPTIGDRIGFTIGGTFAASFLFGAVAAIRNLFVRA